MVYARGVAGDSAVSEERGGSVVEAIAVRFIERIQRTPTVVSFKFLPEKKIHFLAGQFLQVLFDPQDMKNRDVNKYLSFSASPTHDYIEVTKRISTSLFSQKLQALRSGEEVVLRVPLGHCTLKGEYKKVGFLTGGIGIAPVISMLEYIVTKKMDTDVVLFYSNRTEEEIAFKKELDTWCVSTPMLRVFYSVTHCQPRDTNCIAGRITKDILLERVDDWYQRTVFIFGPPALVEAMKKLSVEVDCDTNNVMTETFVGY